MKCRENVNDSEEAVMCDQCNNWFHIACVNISKADYRVLSKLGKSTKWLCKKCEKSPNSTS